MRIPPEADRISKLVLVRTYHFTIFGKNFGAKWADKRYRLPMLPKMSNMGWMG
jgi:hypothetical protein